MREDKIRDEIKRLKVRYDNRIKLRESSFRYMFLFGAILGLIRIMTGGLMEFSKLSSGTIETQGGGFDLILGGVTFIFSITFFMCYRSIQNFFIRRIRKKANELKKLLPQK